MAKLTRTQKFADLRDSLANDKEPSLSTKELSAFEDRLANITGETLEKQDQESVKRVSGDSKYIWNAFEESNNTSYNPYSYSKQNDNNYNNKYVWNSLQEFPETSKNAFNIDELPIIEDDVTKIEAFQPVNKNYTQENPVLRQDAYRTPQSNPYEEAQLDTRNVSTKELIKQQEARYKELSNTNPDIEKAYDEAEKDKRRFEGNVDNVNQTVEMSKDRIDTEAEKHAAMQFLNNITYEEKPEETVGQVVDERHVEEHADVRVPEDIDNNNQGSSLINETIDEVGEYNRSVGEETITTLTNNLVQQVRHPNEAGDKTNRQPEVEETKSKNDEEFSNTVSLEITKIIDEINDTGEIEEATNVETQDVEEEHPVLTKALEEEIEEDVVEIKNINELESEASSNTISNTIPFVVAAGDEEIIEEDEEDDSNTILNIILIVLILVLVAVLGLIIFYILKTKGII